MTRFKVQETTRSDIPNSKLKGNTMKHLTTHLPHLLLGILLLTSCANVSTKSDRIYKQKPKYAKIIDNQTTSNLSFNAFIERIAKYDIVLIGESHSTTNHLQAEYDIIHALKKHKKLSIVYEMLESSHQDSIDSALAKRDTISKAELPQKIKWKDEFSYQGYNVLLESLFYAGDSIVGGNINELEMYAIANGKVKPISGKYSTQKSVKDTLKAIIASFHSKKGDWQDTFVNIQQWKDRIMAEALISHDNAVFIGGMYHATKQLGIPLHIKDIDKSNKSVVVISLDDGENLGINDADYTIYFKP